MIELFASGFVLALSLCLDLGLVNVAAMRVGARDGAWPSFVLGLGSGCGDMIYAGAAMLGISAVLSFAGVRWSLWAGGSLVLAYLALRMLRESLRPAPLANLAAGEAPPARRLAGYFAQGLGLALASPSAILWFAAVGGAVIASTAGRTGGGVWPFLAGFFGGGLAWSAVIAVASSRCGRLGAGFVRAVSVGGALVFAALAVKVFLDGYAEFVAR